ncbi:hypothetical protein E0Z10_g8123 [Xylaria hypoxylon]|uniref:DUF6604 domain-containing protein n=1 Tax=Xylaria hypoxylon TaxID=37992 RepID=A0A4Z0YQC4_9PEZI|nr:hypothetical protein E0Z10_g8123 [Xylaria hypoxylon]
MLPPELLSEYQRYKHDTNSIASWLASTARSLGFTSSALPPATVSGDKPETKGRLKGKARQLAKEKAASPPPVKDEQPVGPNYIIGIQDYITLAEYIASKSAPVPRAFTTTLNRVITARTRFYSKLEKYDKVPDEDDDAKHKYFIHEGVREILEPLMEDDKDQEAPISNPSLHNRFDKLELHEPSQAFLETPDVERPSNFEGDEATYVAEAMASILDSIVTLTIFLNNVNDIRDHLKWVWLNYKNGGFDLAAAAITTNTAIEIVRQMMEDIEPSLKLDDGVGPMIKKIYMLQCLEEGRSMKDIIDPNNNVNYDTYDTASDTFFTAYIILRDCRHILRPDNILLFQGSKFGYYDPTSGHDQKTGHQKHKDDRAVLMSFCSQAITIVREMKKWPIQDEFMRGINEIDKTKEIPFYAIFAAQVFLDITYTLGEDIEKPFHTMHEQIAAMDDDIGLHLEFHSQLTTARLPALYDQILRKFQDCVQLIYRDPVPKLQSRIDRDDGIPAPDEKNQQIFRASPVISGILLYLFRAHYRRAGIVAANAWISIQSCQHLFNALGQHLMIKCPWSDMNAAYKILGASEFYSGGVPPTSLEDMYTKFCFRAGTSATIMGSRIRNQNVSLVSRAGTRGITAASPVQCMFEARHAHCNTHVEVNPGNFHEIRKLNLSYQGAPMEDDALDTDQIEDSKKIKWKRGKRWSNKGQGRRKTTAKSENLNPSKMLEHLILALQAETPRFSFPYLKFHRRCWRVLRAVKESCDTLLRQIYTPAYINDEDELPFVVGWILRAAVGGRHGDLRPLQEAAKALETYIQSETGIPIVSNIPIQPLLGEKIKETEDESESENDC